MINATTNDELQEQLTVAIHASECIVECLNGGDYEGVKKYDTQRANFVRILSKSRNLSAMPASFNNQLQTLSELNQYILTVCNQLRDNVLTEILSGKKNIDIHKQYLINQYL